MGLLAPAYLPEEEITLVNAKPKLIVVLMIFLFATMSPLPRAVEYTVFTAKNVLTNLVDKRLCAATIREIFDESMGNMKIRYPNMSKSDLPPDLMRSILFREQIPLTEKIMSLIQNSLLTNSLDSITSDTQVIPTTNILSAYIYGEYAAKPYEYREILSSLSNELLDMFGAGENETVADVGKYLELIATGVMNLRLQTSYEIAKKKGTGSSTA